MGIERTCAATREALGVRVSRAVQQMLPGDPITLSRLASPADLSHFMGEMKSCMGEVK